MVPDKSAPKTMGRVSLIEVPGWRKFSERAREARDNYESHLRAIMQQHGISSEAEMFTGVISSHSRFNSMKHDKENAEIVIGKQIDFLMKTTKEHFEKDVKNLVAAAHEDEEEALMIKRQLASAWFMLVYGERDDRERTFFSFPWSIAPALAETLKWLKSENSPRRI